MKEKKTILIIEDEEVLLRALYIRLKKLGFIISSATDGETGLQVAQRIKPDLILLDLILPKMGGFEVLEVLKADLAFKKIPIIVLSNLGDNKDIKKAKSLGATDYFVKANTKLEVIEKKISHYFE